MSDLTAIDVHAPAHLRQLDYPTPYLLMDLGRVEHAYRQFTTRLPGVRVHYAMKCNPHRQILQRLYSIGSRFEIASLEELLELMSIGVEPRDVIFSNPVKMPTHIARAFALGVRRFGFDSFTELDKIAAAAPGAAVFVRLAMTPAASLVPSEGKFGVDTAQALKLMQYAQKLGLDTYGVAFHVGSQMYDPAAWTAAISQSADFMRRLRMAGITVRMLDMGGGFPARYQGDAIDITAFTAAINGALGHLPYDVELLIEPGRALVGNAGVMVATVIGLAERQRKQWVHLDVGAFNGMMEALETQNQLPYPVKDSRSSSQKQLCHLTGPSCDSQDTILFDTRLSKDLAVGDQVYIYTAGAYTTSYASRFNGFSLPQTYCV